MKSYEELITLKTFEERFNYLKLTGKVGVDTFGGHREINQILYRSPEWKRIRRKVIVRDDGCDLGIDDRPIERPRKILIHHINPITIKQVIEKNPMVFDMNNLITVSFNTHNAIHYGDNSLLTPTKPTERKPGDTKLW